MFAVEYPWERRNHIILVSLLCLVRVIVALAYGIKSGPIIKTLLNGAGMLRWD